MHRLKSPFVALVAMLILAGPMLGRIARVDPNDLYQISTPSAWERSQGLAGEETTIELEFHHSVQSRENPIAQVDQLEDQILLFGEDRVTSLDRESLTVAWEITLAFWSDPAHRSYMLDDLTGEGSRHIIVGNSSTHALIDIDTGTLVWERSKPWVEFTTRYEVEGPGLVLMYEETDEFWYRGPQLLNATSGEVLTVFPDSGLPDIEVSENFYLVQTDYEMYAASLDTGRMLWSLALPGEDSYASLEEDIVLIRSDEELIGLDPATGQELWLLYIPPDSSIADTNTTLALVMSDDEIVSVDLQTGLQLQVIPTVANDSWYPYLSGDRFINFDDRGMALVDARTGEEIWRLDGLGEDISAFSLGENGVIQGSSGTFAVIDGTTGDLLWSDEGTVMDTLDEENLLWNSGNELALRNGSDGSQIWSHTSPESIDDADAGYGYVVLTTATTITWLDVETGEQVQQVERLAGWEEIRPAGRLFFVTTTNGVTMHDPHSGREWDLPGATYQGNLGWGSEGDYFTVSFGEVGEEGYFWLFSLATGEIIWENVAEDEQDGLYDAADGVVIVYDETYPGAGEGMVRKLVPDGTVAWEIPVDGEVTGLSRREEHGKIVLTLAYGTLVLDEATGETILHTDNYDDPGLNTTPSYYASVQFAPGRIFEPGTTVSRVYRTADVLPEVLKEDTVLRGAPNATSVDRGTFAAGTQVTRTGNERDGADGLWLEVTIDGTTGWVPRDALTDAAPSTSATPAG